ncbi:uncharacterized protein N7503_006825 [Penicillium pulvis]|uniref:uncharacterized protein n=1 Tax=Penicillium pulvis TaxID=1562058 RepID=UPI002546642E|nr:uncharacterized protein N7503_006825 [Penicillium pulvis]KAJ5797529.1 hypothetical protein N7503_006825 [Penicillium pulvis]
MVHMEARVSKETLTALQTDLTLRCFLTARFKRDLSRHSENVIPWAHSRAEEVSTTLLRDIGLPTTEFNIQMNIIQMLRSSTRVYICYDIFLAECDKQLRDEIHKSFIPKRPIHQVVKSGNVYHIAMKKGMEQIVAEQYLGMRSSDSGPLPLFSDLQNPPLYIDGRRVEDWGQQEEEHSPERASEEVELNSLANLGDGGTEHRLADEDNATKAINCASHDKTSG